MVYAITFVESSGSIYLKDNEQENEECLINTIALLDAFVTSNCSGQGSATMPNHVVLSLGIVEKQNKGKPLRSTQTRDKSKRGLIVREGRFVQEILYCAFWDKILDIKAIIFLRACKYVLEIEHSIL